MSQQKGSTPTKLNAISSGFAPSLITDTEPQTEPMATTGSEKAVVAKMGLLKQLCRLTQPPNKWVALFEGLKPFQSKMHAIPSPSM